MSRLVDYFVITGYDLDKDRDGISQGKIIQRFPEKDWEDTPFVGGMELFCQPVGWILTPEMQEPKFFVSLLSDNDGNRYFCACLSFHEKLSISPSKNDSKQDSSAALNIESYKLPGLNHSLASTNHIMYAPTCLVLVSRHDYAETFRNCLKIIYTVHIENMGLALEKLIGNLLGSIFVPPAGGPQIHFSIGAKDKQFLQPPATATLPVTGQSVAGLFQQLGITNTLTIFSAALTEQKVLFYSSSCARLYAACHALTSLMFPFRYNHDYFPILPASLFKVFSTQKPFIVGVLSSLRDQVTELVDVIVADLDGGAVHIPENMSVPSLPEPLLTQIHDALCLVLQPELHSADCAFPSSEPVNQSDPFIQDKEVRAIFIRTLAQLLQGYRHCLTLLRIHPKPVITFHKAVFLGHRELVGSDFTTRLLDSLSFNTFVAERGPSWRICDVWDHVYSTLVDQLKAEANDSKLVLNYVRKLAGQLASNETPLHQPFIQRIPRPTEGSHTRIHHSLFPRLSNELIQQRIDQGLTNGNANLVKAASANYSSSPCFVPLGPPLSRLQDSRPLLSNSAQSLETLRNCIHCIFANKISDARKSFSAVLQALKTRDARLALCVELSQHISGSRAILDPAQFDLVVRLMNCALQNSSVLDEYGVATALLPLAASFCRKLCTGVVQFAYTCIQDHPVWQSKQFWEAAFYQDVQRSIHALYLPMQSSTSNDNSKLQEVPVLEIAAQEMRHCPSMTFVQRVKREANEESTIYSQAIHYANRMVYLLLPLETEEWNRKEQSVGVERNSVTTSFTNTNDVNSERSGVNDDSGFDEVLIDEEGKGAMATRFISRFVDKVCNKSNVTPEHMKALRKMISDVVAMHLEMLETVSREAQRFPPIQKPKILPPSLLNGERLLMEGLRVYLFPDDREEGAVAARLTPLPAEGALFLTNYRIIFKGASCDTLACEQFVCTFFVTLSTKKKHISAHQWLQEGLKLRSNTTQFFKVAFGEDVDLESVELLRKNIHRIRHPYHQSVPVGINCIGFW